MVVFLSCFVIGRLSLDISRPSSTELHFHQYSRPIGPTSDHGLSLGLRLWTRFDDLQALTSRMSMTMALSPLPSPPPPHGHQVQSDTVGKGIAMLSESLVDRIQRGNLVATIVDDNARISKESATVKYYMYAMGSAANLVHEDKGSPKSPRKMNGHMRDSSRRWATVAPLRPAGSLAECMEVNKQSMWNRTSRVETRRMAISPKEALKAFSGSWMGDLSLEGSSELSLRAPVRRESLEDAPRITLRRNDWDVQSNPSLTSSPVKPCRRPSDEATESALGNAMKGMSIDTFLLEEISEDFAVSFN